MTLCSWNGQADAEQSSKGILTPKLIAQTRGHISSLSSTDPVAIFSTVSGLKLVVTSPSSPETQFTSSLPGSYLWSDKNGGGLRLRDIVGDGLGEIVCESSDGASLGAYLRIFKFHDASFDLISPSNAGGYEFDFVKLGQGEEVIIYGKWTEAKLATVDALKWNGSHLVYDRASARTFLDKRLSLETREITNRSRQSTISRATKARVVVELLLKSGEYERALHLCDQLLPLIKDPSLAIPPTRSPNEASNLRPEQLAQLGETQTLQALSAVHSLLADIYKRLRKITAADREQLAAKKLASEATAKLEMVYSDPAR